MTALPKIGTRCLVQNPEGPDTSSIGGVVVGYGTQLISPAVEQNLGSEFHATEYPTTVVLVQIMLTLTYQVICIHPENMLVGP